MGAYLTVSKNRNVDGEYDKSDVLSVSGDYGIVNQIKFQGRSFAGASVLPYGIVETGDIVYTKSPLKANPYGIIKTNHGKNGIVSTLYAIYKVNNDSNGIFVEYYFDDNLRLNKYLKPLVNRGAKNDMKVTDENVLKGDVIFPSLPEQTAIGSFFQDIEQLISLQQCKLEVLKEQKKTYLKLLFPAKGQTKPALRFAGFEDEWKEVKLGEVFEFSKGKGLPMDSFYEGEDNLAIAYGHLYTLYNEVITKVQKSSDNECSMYSNGNELLFPASSTVPFGTAKVVALLESGVKLGGDIIVASPDSKKVNNIFMSYNINSIKEKMFPITVGTTITHMYAKDLKELRYFLPSLSEQEAIGSFFQELNKAIAKQEEKVNQLKESKQTLLRKMFI
ncbi:type IC specificity subunit [Streptococcus pneumoniae]|nr:type IC specificity subunit [Streptococcus pneumoniae]